MSIRPDPVVPTRSGDSALVIASIAMDRKQRLLHRIRPAQSLRPSKSLSPPRKQGPHVRASTRSQWRMVTTLAALAFTGIVVPNNTGAGAPGRDAEDDIKTVESDRPLAEVHESIIPIVPARDESSSAIFRTVSTAAVLDPAARLLHEDDASEFWTLYIELDSGHRITQRFLITNAGPGEHSAVAIGHLSEPGREPYRYQNGRRRARWTLSEDRLFFDIAASHLDLHRPTGELRITKKDIEIRLFFDFAESALASRVPDDRLPKNYHVDILAVAAETSGTIQAPWMSEPLETRGLTWLAHTWTRKDEAKLVDRRIEIFGNENGTSFYGIQITRGTKFSRGWVLAESGSIEMIESLINVPASWLESIPTGKKAQTQPYPVPRRFAFSEGTNSGQITLKQEWLRFDPLAMIPQPFRWFIRMRTKPQEVWADAVIGVTLSPALETPSLPDTSETESGSNSKRETEVETAERSVTGVASITFMNPAKGR